MWLWTTYIGTTNNICYIYLFLDLIPLNQILLNQNLVVIPKSLHFKQLPMQLSCIQNLRNTVLYKKIVLTSYYEEVCFHQITSSDLVKPPPHLSISLFVYPVLCISIPVVYIFKVISILAPVVSWHYL